MRAVVTLALESDPGELIGASRSVDGVFLLKQQPDYSYFDRSLVVVKGTWQQ